jgi:hypothetical protein
MSATVPLPQVIASVKMLLGLTSSDEDTLLYKLASDAAREMETTDNIIPIEAPLKIENATAFLPNGVVMIRAVRLWTSIGWVYPCYTKSLFPFDQLSNNWQNNQWDYSFAIQDNALIFSSNVNQASCEISYWGLALDADGFPLVTENMELAMQAYICWKYSRLYSMKYPADVRREWKDDWRLTLMKCRSQPQQDYLLKHLGATWNRFTVNKWGSGNFAGFPFGNGFTGII